MARFGLRAPVRREDEREVSAGIADGRPELVVAVDREVRDREHVAEVGLQRPGAAAVGARLDRARRAARAIERPGIRHVSLRGRCRG